MDEFRYPFTPETPLEELRNFYDNLIKKIEIENPRARVIVQAKLITTKINFPEKHLFDTDCLEFCRKIKAVTEARELV